MFVIGERYLEPPDNFQKVLAGISALPFQVRRKFIFYHCTLSNRFSQIRTQEDAPRRNCIQKNQYFARNYRLVFVSGICIQKTVSDER